MISVEDIMSIDKEDLFDVSKKIIVDDIAPLVDVLSSKDDNIRYRVFLLLQHRSSIYDDVYPFWDIFHQKLTSNNSYQRSIGMMMIAENTRWDTQDKILDTLDDCLKLLHDEKPITIRQCIQSLSKIIRSKPNLGEKIASSLITLDLMAIKDTMRKSVLLDIMNTIFEIRKEFTSDSIEGYIISALCGSILDKKSKKMFETLR